MCVLILKIWTPQNLNKKDKKIKKIGWTWCYKIVIFTSCRKIMLLVSKTACMASGGESRSKSRSNKMVLWFTPLSFPNNGHLTCTAHIIFNFHVDSTNSLFFTQKYLLTQFFFNIKIFLSRKYFFHTNIVFDPKKNWPKIFFTRQKNRVLFLHYEGGSTILNGTIEKENTIS